jgi:hypothetical protein
MTQTQGLQPEDPDRDTERQHRVLQLTTDVVLLCSALLDLYFRWRHGAG